MCFGITLRIQVVWLSQCSQFRSSEYESVWLLHSVVLIISVCFFFFPEVILVLTIAQTTWKCLCANRHLGLQLLAGRVNTFQRVPTLVLTWEGSVEAVSNQLRSQCLPTRQSVLWFPHTPWLSLYTPQNPCCLEAAPFHGPLEEVSTSCLLRQALSSRFYTPHDSTEDSQFFLGLGIKVQHEKTEQQPSSSNKLLLSLSGKTLGTFFSELLIQGSRSFPELNRKFPFLWPEVSKTKEPKWESSKEAKTFAFLRFLLGKLMLWHSDTSSISISAKLIKKIVLHTAVSSTSLLPWVIPSAM